MNFLLRATAAGPVVSERPPPVPASSREARPLPPPTPTTLEGLMGEDSFVKSSSSEDGEVEGDENGGEGTSTSGDVSSVKRRACVGTGHSDVTEDEGWIVIPHKALPEDWTSAPDIQSFRPLDRSFVFPGEQLNVLACLSTTSKQDEEVITPFRVAALMSRCGIDAQSAKHTSEAMPTNSNSSYGSDDIVKDHSDRTGENGIVNADVLIAENSNKEDDILVTESLIRMEDHKLHTEMLLERFRNSHFFVRIAESDEPLWEKRTTAESRNNILNVVIDRGNCDGCVSGGLARNTVRCFPLFNGDIVVLLQVNVGTDSLEDPVLEVLQFEKPPTNKQSFEGNKEAVDHDPCQELLCWLLPLDNALSPPIHPAYPPFGSSVGGPYHRPTLSASSSSQLFSFANFRSYSMPSLAQTGAQSSPIIPSSSNKIRFDLEDFDHLNPEKPIKGQDVGMELISFRGVPIQPAQFSVQCGLEGIYIPGKRWRKKLEIIQPIDVHTFTAECNTEELLSVQIKNISPDHAPDVVIFLDSISIALEEASKSVPPCSLPLSCIECGSDHSLPNLVLRRGEEHSFILKPSTSLGGDLKFPANRGSYPFKTQVGKSGAGTLKIPKIGTGSSDSLCSNQYAVLVSYRCNYTESKLFYKKPTSWHPHVAKDIVISVASEISRQNIGPGGSISQLPVQVLTLQASNLTNEDLNLTVLAPTSFTAPPSVISLNSSPTTPVSPFVGFPDLLGRALEDKRDVGMQGLGLSYTSGNVKWSDNGRSQSVLTEALSSDVVSSSDLGCTHLWLQSAVPLGCVPAQSSATVKLELLPLTDGIITLDTLQVAIKEKGLTYVPQHPLKIHATSSVASELV